MHRPLTVSLGRLLALALLFAAAACAADAGSQQGAGSRQDAAVADSLPCEQPRRIAALPAEITEASGVVISRAHPGILWVHGDSDPHLYAVDLEGRLRARVQLARPWPDDWEDIALAPCGSRDCLYVADIGDNSHDRASIEVIRIPEPALSDTVAPAGERFRFRYPEGPRDAEALFVLPSGTLYIVSKGRKGPIALYRAPTLAENTIVTLERVRSFTSGLVQIPDQVTGADAAIDGKWVALRTYSYLDLYPVSADSLATSATLRVPLGTLQEPQGEGVALGADGVAYFVSERASGPPAPLSRVACRLR